MLNEKCFKQNLSLLAINFGFKLDDDNGLTYMRMVFDAIKDRTTDMLFSKSVNLFIRKKTQKEWNADFGFTGKPAVADFLREFTPQPIMVKVFKDLPNGGKMFVWEQVAPNLSQLEIESK